MSTQYTNVHGISIMKQSLLIRPVCWCEKLDAEELDLKMDCWKLQVAVLVDQLLESPATHSSTSLHNENICQ